MTNNKIKILITGGAGFIGTNLTKALLKQKQSVFCIDNLNDYYSPNIKKKNIEQFETNPNYKFQKLDIENLDDLKKLFSKQTFDVVVHLAARAGVRASIENPSNYIQTNIHGTLNLLECIKNLSSHLGKDGRDKSIKKFIFASSSSVYGNIKKVPFKEDMNINTPISPYAATKLSCEAICYTYHHLYNINMVGLRLFTVYGPHNRPDMAAYKFTKAIIENQNIEMYGDGNTSRDYTYIDDIVSGIIKSIDLENNFEIINLGNSSPIKLKSFIQTFEKVIGKKANIIKKPIPIGDVMQTYADISKAKELLNWEPKISLREGLSKLIKWYRNK